MLDWLLVSFAPRKNDGVSVHDFATGATIPAAMNEVRFAPNLLGGVELLASKPHKMHSVFHAAQSIRLAFYFKQIASRARLSTSCNDAQPLSTNEPITEPAYAFDHPAPLE